ncbi:stalk domain-containing protein [Paenibacillus sp. J2TS4]|uniref:stalk domain-containing protein n=1 Tax=Paenibacillus sp. J2TS4 TaxID=2807194 RepID=UPI001B107546|nr:stalk domain-containing protein [Paenibacillus sp. J2TS4]GIP32697.1 serine protease [Paenibacillus sp. J2TS4]
MKLFISKFHGWLALWLMAALFVTGNTAAAAADKITINVNGQSVSFPDMQPTRVEGRVLVPLRQVLEAMGAEVKWNNKSQSAVATLNQSTVEIMLDSRYIQASNGTDSSQVVQLDIPAILLEGRTMIPLRASGELLGFSVSWDEATLTADLKSGGPSSEPALSFPHYPLQGDIKQLHEEELDAFFLTNSVRERHKAGIPLGLHVELSQVAREKSKDMSDKDYFDHSSPTYGSPFDMMKSFGISFNAAGENIAMGYPTPEEVVTGWEHSPGHLSNIVSENFAYIGVGYIEGSNVFWTQMFTD